MVLDAICTTVVTVGALSVEDAIGLHDATACVELLMTDDPGCEASSWT